MQKQQLLPVTINQIQTRAVKPVTNIRCLKCNKMLGKIKGEAEIKCPRCGKMSGILSNVVKVIERRLMVSGGCLPTRYKTVGEKQH